jgi:hypothetical protein
MFGENRFEEWFSIVPTKYTSWPMGRAYGQILQALGDAWNSRRPWHPGYDCLATWQWWVILGFFGLQHAILGPHFLSDAFYGTEALSTSLMKSLHMVDRPNRVWTTYGLDQKGWKNCAICKLSNQVQEWAANPLFKCPFTIRVWSSLESWLAFIDIQRTIALQCIPCNIGGVGSSINGDIVKKSFGFTARC